jgi:hypothetical protein
MQLCEKTSGKRRAIDNGPQHETLGRRQIELLESVHALALEPTLKRRGIEVEAVIKHGTIIDRYR